MVQVPEKARQFYLPKLEGINSLQIQPFQVPKPKANQVLVKIHAASLNFRDLIIAQNQYPAAHPNLVPCSDGAGEVVAVGESVKKWKIGDRVSANFAIDHISGDTNPEIQGTALGGSIDGVLAEYQVFPDYSLVRIPDYLSYEEAATLPCAAVTAWNALHGPVPVKAGDFVLIQGTGGVSVFALQIAAASGATVIATSSSDDKLAKAKELGATHLINYKTTPDWDKEVLKITNGQGVNHVIEVGGPATIDKSLNCLHMNGWIHVIGFLAGMKLEGETPLPMKVLFKAGYVRGILVGSRTQFEDMNRAFEANHIKPVVDSIFEFEETVAAYKRLESQKHLGKIVIRVAPREHGSLPRGAAA